MKYSFVTPDVFILDRHGYIRWHKIDQYFSGSYRSTIDLLFRVGVEDGHSYLINAF